MSECKLTTRIYLRGDVTPRYCVSSTCSIHKAEWSGLTDDWETAGNMLHQFPLVHGGLSFGDGGRRIPLDCIIASIPVKPNE